MTATARPTQVTQEKHALAEVLGYESYADFETEWAKLSVRAKLDLRVEVRKVMS